MKKTGRFFIIKSAHGIFNSI